MPAAYASTWQNLLTITSALQSEGLVTDFNGVLRNIGSDTVEIAANKRPIEDASEQLPYYLDAAHDGFYRGSEYAELDKTRNYSFKLLDGALIQFFCVFNNDEIARQRLTFYQSPM